MQEKNNSLERDIFFWLGKDSSQDEQGVAAYKTVELDQSLGDEPVQHREVQGHETDEFLSLFKNGLRYLEGGVATGFKHVDRDAYETRLLHIKGRRNIRVQQVKLDPTSMNEGDVFVLDAGKDIFQWNGKEASRVEKPCNIASWWSIADNRPSLSAASAAVSTASASSAMSGARVEPCTSWGRTRTPSRVHSSFCASESGSIFQR